MPYTEGKIDKRYAIPAKSMPHRRSADVPGPPLAPYCAGVVGREKKGATTLSPAGHVEGPSTPTGYDWHPNGLLCFPLNCFLSPSPTIGNRRDPRISLAHPIVR